MTQKIFAYDESWKDIIEDFLEDFILFFAPDLYQQIDFSQKHEFKEKEFNRLFPRAKSRKSRVDKLIKLHLNNGQPQYLLVHVEVQGNSQKDFSKRMFRYFYRIYDKFQEDIFTLVILTDPVYSYNPDHFEYKFLNTELKYKYRTYKVIEQSENELKKNDNPFAKAVLASLYRIKSKNNIDQKYQFKFKLIKLLLQDNISKEKINKLLIFIDRVLYLPPEKEKEINNKINNMKEKGEIKMGLTWDKSNLADAYREIGKKEGIEKIVFKLLALQFGQLPMNYQEKLSQLNETELEKVAEKILEVEKLEELEQYIFKT